MTAESSGGSFRAIMKLGSTITTTGLLAALVACGGAVENPELAEESAGEVSAAIHPQVRVLGSISSGQTRSTTYSSHPRYRAYRFTASGGDTIAVDVSARQADAMVWITDASFSSLAFNDDARRGTRDAHVEWTVPTGTPSATFFVLFREYSLRNARFSVTLTVQSDDVCEYDGSTYNVGDDFASSDGCNTCSCAPAGVVGCTKRACLQCDPANEPHRNYVGTPDECALIRFVCVQGTHYFQSDCGCGCEND